MRPVSPLAKECGFVRLRGGLVAVITPNVRCAAVGLAAHAVGQDMFQCKAQSQSLLFMSL